MSHGHPAMPPLHGPDRVFWDGVAARRLVYQRCRGCGAPVFRPRMVCPECLSEDLAWVESAGRGRIYSFTVVHRAPHPVIGGGGPHVVALVDLEEGFRVMSNIVGCPPDRVAVGMPVVVRFEEFAGGLVLPLFAPAGEGGEGRR